MYLWGCNKQDCEELIQSICKLNGTVDDRSAVYTKFESISVDPDDTKSQVKIKLIEEKDECKRRVD